MTQTPTEAALTNPQLISPQPTNPPLTEEAILAGGCFWGLEMLFQTLAGVLDSDVGYVGGQHPNPTYQAICTGTTGHAEALKVTFNPAILSYVELLAFFFQVHNPCTLNQQGNDRGTQYRSALFYTSPEQKRSGEAFMAAAHASGRWPASLVTELSPASTFYVAEPYHQDYLQKNPQGYNCHRRHSEWQLDATVLQSLIQEKNLIQENAKPATL